MRTIFKLKLISNVFGIDDRSPLYPSLEHAQTVARRMLALYQGNLLVEIYQMTDMQTGKRNLVDSIGFIDNSWKKWASEPAF
jgi:hypothetical protein